VRREWEEGVRTNQMRERGERSVMLMRGENDERE
jgi:hypothetical protein